MDPSAEAGPGPSTSKSRARIGFPSSGPLDKLGKNEIPINSEEVVSVDPEEDIPVAAVFDPEDFIPSHTAASTISSKTNPVPSSTAQSVSVSEPSTHLTLPIVPRSTTALPVENDGSWLNPAVMGNPSRRPSPSSPAPPQTSDNGSGINSTMIRLKLPRKRIIESSLEPESESEPLPQPRIMARRTGKKLKRILSTTPVPSSTAKRASPTVSEEAVTSNLDENIRSDIQSRETTEDPLLLTDEPMVVDEPAGNSLADASDAKVERAVDAVLVPSLADVDLDASEANVASLTGTLDLPVFDPDAFMSRRRKKTQDMLLIESSHSTPTPPLDTSSGSSGSDDAEVARTPADYPDMHMTAEEWRGIVEVDGETDIDVLRQRLITSTDEDKQIIYVDPYDACTQSLVVEQPPPHLRGTARRRWDCQALDELNRRLPTVTYNPQILRLLFEDFIAQSEQESGGIRVVNQVDAEPAPPDFEFICSNEMLYHPDVPDPEIGLGCGCDGPCDPDSKTCTCVKRQEAYGQKINASGFAYNS
jgi:hypothetical protein